MRQITFTDHDLTEIIERSSSMEERMNSGFFTAQGAISGVLFDSRLQTWCRTAAHANRALFLQRLACDSLTGEQLKNALGPVRLTDRNFRPEWAVVLQEAINLSLEAGERSANKPAETECINTAEPVPFEDILIPFIGVARRRLKSLSGQAYGQLSREAHSVLERSLLQKLAYFAGRTLFLEFSLLRQKRLPQALLDLETILKPDGGGIYKQFIASMQAGKMVSFFKEYAVLGRLLASSVLLWTESIAQFLSRLSADRTDIQQLFGYGAIEQVQLLGPDPLRGERLVIALTFDSGRKLVYKPRNLSIDDAFYRLIDWVNGSIKTLPLKRLKILNRATHGWIEYVDHAPCKTQEEARHYYLRAGMLLGLVYFLLGTDCHYKNIIACGSSPVLIDTETLLQPRLPFHSQGAADPQYMAYVQIMDTVINTGLLPILVKMSDQGTVCDISGLNGSGLNEPYQEESWLKVNTDAMTPGPARFQTRSHVNIPHLEGAPLRLEDYSKELISGFVLIYRLLEQQRDFLLAPGSPLQAMAELKIRFVFRPNRVYYSIFRQMLNPACMRDGADYSIQSELLARKYLAESEPDQTVPRLWPLLAAEKMALRQGKLPYFMADSGSTDLNTPTGEVIKQCLAKASFDRLTARLQKLSGEDMKKQVKIIREACSRSFSLFSTGSALNRKEQ